MPEVLVRSNCTVTVSMLSGDRMGGAESRVAKSGKPIQMMKKYQNIYRPSRGRGPDDGWGTALFESTSVLER